MKKEWYVICGTDEGYNIKPYITHKNDLIRIYDNVANLESTRDYEGLYTLNEAKRIIEKEATQ